MPGYGKKKDAYNFWPEDFPRLESTADCARAYGELRLAGAVPNQEARERLLASEFCLDADDVLHASGAAGMGEGKLSRVGLDCHRKMDPNPSSERQQTGDCVSKALQNCGDESRAVEIVVQKQPELWIARGSSEVYYGARGWRGQGANCSTLAYFAHRDAGLLVRQEYPVLGLDLREYDAEIGISWGGSGVPAAVVAEARKTPFRFLAQVKTWEQYRDFAAVGIGRFWCAGISYSSQRDANGVAEETRQGWSHSQSNGAIVDDTPWAHENYGEPLFSIWQTWGTGFASGGWNVERYGPAHGSLSLLRKSVFDRVLRTGDIWAVGDFDGIKRRIDALKNWGATDYLGAV